MWPKWQGQITVWHIQFITELTLKKLFYLSNIKNCLEQQQQTWSALKLKLKKTFWIPKNFLNSETFLNSKICLSHWLFKFHLLKFLFAFENSKNLFYILIFNLMYGTE